MELEPLTSGSTEESRSLRPLLFRAQLKNNARRFRRALSNLDMTQLDVRYRNSRYLDS